ncbi:hypothetical protein AVEN_254686-1 [Araneus ventricosus]|uniref:Mos1 transposase HTH domain-containing protein n=1 Tax=Araneus ventricosus TaxID=182803 RepID=A0A4Y2R4Y6_ARAVE|nr:hypothetical protein AVEN_254686-1 [Araneus ventricosus]
MSRQATAKWCNMFENGRKDIDDAEREGRPSTATNSEIAARVNERILTNRRVAVVEIKNKLGISHGSVYRNTVKHLEFSKFCA